MQDDLERTFAKLRNPRMSAGLYVLHSLLEPLKGEPIQPKEIRKVVDRQVGERRVTKQSITNVARRLEEAKLIDREEGYQVNYGYLISVLLNELLELRRRVTDMEDELDELQRKVP